ncbi:MAG: HlyD family efflux transporter periplasmic adaptor subunit [Crocinitomicaceae bacterium]|nr:HlyD family efflux transporter periplasmic adaptor subunit [Crocinitomicaceae bacterium]
MLNLSPQNRNQIDTEGLVATQMLNKAPKKLLRNTIYALLILSLVILFLPWTQNIRSNGQVLTLRPEQRPQTINALIGGRIEKWFVKEGDLVRQGDTIMFISEIKDGYFDPQLVGRSEDQLKSKELSVVSYSDKVQALDARIDALIATGKLKVQQARIKAQQAQLKLKSDSIENHAANLNYQIAKDQYERFEKLYERDLKSKTEVETRKVAMQRAQASMIGAQQKFLQSRNDIIDAKVELNAVETKFQDEVSKAESEKFTALSSMYEAEIDVSKMQSQVANYSIRNGMYYILAPQDGRIAKTLSSGIGETIKQGAAIATIMPTNYDLAVEMYVRPMDLPLLQVGQHVRIQFDGWPAIVFSGWPNTSYGTYGGTVFAIDQFANENGEFRVLVAPDAKEHKWPEALRVGGGAYAMLLLNDVPIWYELWRNVNGFPPDYYKAKVPDMKSKTKSIKNEK